MADFSMNDEPQNLINSIDKLTAQIRDRINKHDLDDVKELLSARLDLLSSLVAKASSAADKESIVKYLVDLQSQEAVVLQALSHEHEVVKKAIINLNHIKEYVSNSY